MNDKTESGKYVPFDPWRSEEKIRLLSDILKSKSDVRLRVTGASMAPFLQSGSIVTLRKVPTDQLGVGDLILFCCKGETMKLHRLIAFAQKKGCLFDQNVFVTKGDALDSPDQPVNENDYLAKVIRIECVDGDKITYRDMEKSSSRAVNMLRAVYHRIRWFFISRYMKFKARRILDRPAANNAVSRKQPSEKDSVSTGDSSV